jgi:TP901 family phage tail tape measure protein
MSDVILDAEVRLNERQLEQQIAQVGKRAGKSLSINIGKNAKGVEAFTQPLGRITGQADEFTKSMEAANARVLAFGASVGVLGAVIKSFKDLATTVIGVEKQLTSINTILGGTQESLRSFSKEIFDVARNTEQTFAVVADAALELSRQGLKAEEVTKRLNDALILSRLTGQGASEAVSGLTAAINSFNKEGITSSDVLNKLSAAAISAAVSEKDLIEGIKRSGAVAVQAGVSFNELVGVIGAVQEKTARGGAVIGNSFKTIFTRLQSLDKLETMQNLGVTVTDASGKILSATDLIRNLGQELTKLPEAKQLQIAENLVGKFQIAPFLSILEDFNSEQSKAIELTGVAQNASTQAYERNVTLNKTLSAAINEVNANFTQFAANLGELGVSDALKKALDIFVTISEKIREFSDPEKAGAFGKIFQGTLKGLVLPVLVLVGAAFGKLLLNLATFGIDAVKTFFGLNKSAKELVAIQGSIASSLANNAEIAETFKRIENSTLSIEEQRAAKAQVFIKALKEQSRIMKEIQTVSKSIAPAVMRSTKSNAGGYIPNFAGGFGAEVQDISMGVGGAPQSAKAVTIPNFNFGGGMMGPVVANDSEYIVPNFGGGGGSAIFNQDMVSSMGLPANARKINASNGITPLKGKKRPRAGGKGTGQDDRYAMIIPSTIPIQEVEGISDTKKKYKFNAYGFDKNVIKARDESQLKKLVEQAGINITNQEIEGINDGGFTDSKGNKIPPVETAKFNAGSVGGMAGTIFEAAMRSTTKQFKRLGSTNNDSFDFFGAQISGLKKTFPSMSSNSRFIDAKVNINKNQADDFANKMERFGAGTSINISKAGSDQMLNRYTGETSSNFSKRRRVERMLGVPLAKGKSRGYIPNFSGGRIPNYGLGSSFKKFVGMGSGTPQMPPGYSMRDMGRAGMRAIDPQGNMISNKKAAEATEKYAKEVEKASGGAERFSNTLGIAALVTQGFSGGLEGAEKGFGRFASRIADATAGVTSAGFAFQQFKEFGAGGGVLKKVIGRIGMVGAAAFAAFEVFKAGKKLFQDFNGTTDILDASFLKLQQSSEKATVSLESLSKSRQSEIGMEVEDLLSSIGRERAVSPGGSRGFDPSMIGKTVFQSIGIAGEIEEEVTMALKRAIAEGIDPEAIKAIIVKAAEGNNRLDPKEIRSFTRGIVDVMGERAAFRDDLKNNEQLDQIGRLPPGSPFGPNVQQLAITGLAGQLAEDPENNLSAATIREELEKRLSVLIKENAKIQTDSQRKITFKVLERLKTEIAIAKLNTDRVDDLTDELAIKEAIGTSTREDMKLSKLALTDLKASQTIRNETLSSVENLSKLSKELTLEGEKESRLTKLIQNAKKTGVLTEEQRLEIIEATKEMVSESGVEIGKQITAEANRLKIATETVNKERERTKELITQKFTIEDIQRLQQEGIDKESTNINTFFQNQLNTLTAQKNRLTGKSARKGLGPQTILSGEAAKLSQAQDAMTGVNLDSQLRTLSSTMSQIIRAGGSDFVKGDPAIPTFDKETRQEVFLRNALAEAVEKGDKFSLGEFIEDTLGDSRFDEARRKFIETLNKEDAARLESAQTSEEAAKKNLEVARLAGEVLAVLQVQEDFATNLRRGTNQAQAEAVRMIDPAARAKAFLSVNNRGRKADAIDPNTGGGVDETLFRQILEQELLAGQLIDASQQFASNIGNAMIDAVSKGESLKDSLLSAASTFFDTMSRALMDNAVKGIISGGPGGSGFFGGLGKALGFNSGGAVSGGSGMRDDVPALLTGGEFVMSKGAVQNYGAGFMGALNSGAVPKYAKGGLFTPGTYGQGSIRGSSNLLNFATQSYTGGLQDQFLSGPGLAGLSLEPQSGRLTMFGRKNSPAFQREQDSKRKAFDLFAQQYSKNQEEKSKGSSSNIFGSILGFALSAGASSLFGSGLSSIFSKGKATGGAVPYSAGIDSVPTMLSGGEFVMNAGASQRLGAGNLAALNAGGGIGGGGGDGAIVGKLDELNETIASSNTEINITVNSDGNENTNSSSAPEQQRNLAVRIKDVVRQVIEDEKRLGGSLRMA